MADYREDGKPQDYTEIIEAAVFLGDLPYQSIKDSIKTQFEDYVNLEDNGDYVDAFYSQLKMSLENISDDDPNPDDRFEVLYNLKSDFESFMEDIFERRLGVTIAVVDNEETEEDELELAFRRLYEFFILNGRTYLKYVIASTTAKSLQYTIEEDSEFYHVVRDMLTQFSPFMIALSPLEYIKTVGQLYDAVDVQELFESGQITGNFLRKYSPKLYKNEDFECEIISDITMWAEWNREPHEYEENVQFASYLQNE